MHFKGIKVSKIIKTADDLIAHSYPLLINFKKPTSIPIDVVEPVVEPVKPVVELVKPVVEEKLVEKVVEKPKLSKNSKKKEEVSKPVPPTDDDLP